MQRTTRGRVETLNRLSELVEIVKRANRMLEKKNRDPDVRCFTLGNQFT